MARYPKATWRPVVGLDKDPPITAVGVVLHVRGGTGDSLFGYFNGPSGGIESHFYLNNKLGWEQYRDTAREADANYEGNSWVVNGVRYGFLSVETEGGANGAWSPEVMAELKEFLTWASKEHGFPLVRATGFHGTGVGYHVMFGAGKGLNAWSNAAGKVCPGPERIAQFYNDIVPWMNAGPTPTPAPALKGNPDMGQICSHAGTAWWIDGAGRRRRVPSPEYVNNLKRGGAVDIGPVSTAYLGWFPYSTSGDDQTAAILAAVKAGGTPEQVAAAVIAELVS